MRAISSTEEVSWRTGRRPLRATPQPAMPAPITPARPKSSITLPSLASSASWESSDWAMIMVRLSSRPSAITRKRVPSSAVMVRMDSSSLPRITLASGSPRVTDERPRSEALPSTAPGVMQRAAELEAPR